MRDFLRRVTAVLLPASILVASLPLSEGNAARPWLNRVDKPISQIFMQQDQLHMSQLHYGVDFPPYTPISQRWDTLTAMVEGEFINCNDYASSDWEETFVLFKQSGEDGVYYTYRHIKRTSVGDLFHHDCDWVREHTPSVDTTTPVAESWHLPNGEISDLHIEASWTLPLGTNDYVHNPLLDFESDLLVPDQNEPFVSDCTWYHQGPWGTVRFKALD